MSQDAVMAAAIHSPVPVNPSACARNSLIIAVISGGRPSPSRNSTPSSCTATELFRSSAPSYGLTADRDDGSAVLHRAALNGAARRGAYRAEMEHPVAAR